MEILDISQTLEKNMVKYPSLPKYKVEWLRLIENKDTVNLSLVTIASHIGTHIDAPYHFIQEGKKIDEFDINMFFGPAKVIQVPRNKERIDLEIVKSAGELPKRVLFKTNNSFLYSKKKFDKEYVYIDDNVAEYLKNQNVKLVGIDYVSVDKYGAKNNSVHNKLLSGNIAILEGLVMDKVKPGTYTLICFPLKFNGTEASPCRAVLINKN